MRNQFASKVKLSFTLNGLFLLTFFLAFAFTVSVATAATSETRYVEIGDSHTIGAGAKPEQSWPMLLTAHLNQAGIPTTLVANPSAMGWTFPN